MITIGSLDCIDAELHRLHVLTELGYELANEISYGEKPDLVALDRALIVSKLASDQACELLEAFRTFAREQRGISAAELARSKAEGER